MSVITSVYLYKKDPERSWNESSQNCEFSRYLQAVQGEAGSEELKFHLFTDTQPVDLSGKTVTFYLTKPDGQQVFLPASVPQETAAQGIASVTLTAQCTAAAGIATHGEIRITGNDGSALKFQTPNLYIAASKTENAVESSSEYLALDIALNKTDLALENSKAALDLAQTVLSGAQQAALEASSAASGANVAAERASSAAAQANLSATAASDTVSSAGTAAQKADAAADRATAAATFCESISSNLSNTIAAEIDTRKGVSGGIAAYDTLSGHLSDRTNPHCITALQVGVCNRNLLTDGSFQVWQEAQEFSGFTGRKYAATMWQVWADGVTCEVSKTGIVGGISIKNTSGDSVSVRVVSLVEKGTIKPGTSYTAAVRGIRNGAIFTISAEDYGKAAFASQIVTEGSPSFSFTAPAVLDSHFAVTVQISGLAANSTAEIDTVKLEEGVQFTGFCTEQYADVFMRTLRYYQRGLDNRSMTLANPFSGTATLFIPLHIPMRALPTVSVIAGSDLANGIGVAWEPSITPVNLRCLESHTTGIILGFDNAALDKQYLLRTDIIQADARL